MMVWLSWMRRKKLKELFLYNVMCVIGWAMGTGAGERNRTLDLLITSELLYQLSYTGVCLLLLFLFFCTRIVRDLGMLI